MFSTSNVKRCLFKNFTTRNQTTNPRAVKLYIHNFAGAFPLKTAPAGPPKNRSLSAPLSYPNAKLPGTNYAGSGSNAAKSNQVDGGGAADEVCISDRIFCAFIGFYVLIICNLVLRF